MDNSSVQPAVEPLPQAAAHAQRRRSIWQAVRQFREGGMLLAVIGTGVIFTLIDPRFASVRNLSNIASQISFLAILAVGMTYVLIAGEVDLSVGSTLGLATIAFGLLLEANVNIWLAAVLT